MPATKGLQIKKEYFQNAIEGHTVRIIPKAITALMKIIIITGAVADFIAVLMNRVIMKEASTTESTEVALMQIRIIIREVIEGTAYAQMTVLMKEIVPVQMRTVGMKGDAGMIQEALSLTCIINAQVVVKEILTATGVIIEEDRGLTVKTTQQREMMGKRTKRFMILNWKGKWVSSLTIT